MPKVDLTDEEIAATMATLREAVHFDRFTHRALLAPINSTLAKLVKCTEEPASAASSPTVPGAPGGQPPRGGPKKRTRPG